MTTTDTKTPTTTPMRGEAAVRLLWTRAIDAGDEAKAKTIATIANLLAPEIKLASAPAVPAKTDPKPATVSVDGAAVDLSEMEDADARDYAAYAREMDGSAARERHIRRLEEEDAEMREIFGGRDGG